MRKIVFWSGEIIGAVICFVFGWYIWQGTLTEVKPSSLDMSGSHILVLKLAEGRTYTSANAVDVSAYACRPFSVNEVTAVETAKPPTSTCPGETIYQAMLQEVHVEALTFPPWVELHLSSSQPFEVHAIPNRIEVLAGRFLSVVLALVLFGLGTAFWNEITGE